MAALQELAGDEQTSFPGDAGDAARDSLGGLAETQGRIIALLERVLPALNERAGIFRLTRLKMGSQLIF